MVQDNSGPDLSSIGVYQLIGSGNGGVCFSGDRQETKISCSGHPYICHVFIYALWGSHILDYVYISDCTCVHACGCAIAPITDT